MMKALLFIFALGVVMVASPAGAQIVMEKAVVSNAGGTTSNATTTLHYTVGETAVGAASNSTTVGRFGFWNSPSILAFVKGSGAGAIKDVSLYPNPTSNAVTVSVELATAGTLELRLYNAAGQMLSTLYSGKKNAGTHSVRADISTLATGTYFLAALVPGGLVQSRLTIVR